MSQNAAKMGQNAAGKMKPFVDRNFGFGMKALRKYPELLPLTIMCGIGYAVGFAYMGFGLVAKADVRINPWEKVARSERTDVSNMTKVCDCFYYMEC
ncbi:hypothetical protein LSAT2_028815 [Lamellibrachia satsuma]|nr:hypothetical protein LSAT2_028815 [Lamellibrachia satsuma]